MNDDTPEAELLDRRGMLRRAGVVVAGAAGAAVAGAVAATPAQAAPGDPVVQGAANDAGTAATSLRTSTASGATLTLGNPAQDAVGDGGASLALTPHTADFISESTPAGSMMLAADGTVRTAPPDGAGGAYHNHYLYDSFNSTFTVPVNPYRAVDTRGDKSRLFGTSGKFDSSGRLLAGKTVHLDISDLVSFSWGVMFNLSVVSPTGTGYMRVWPYGQPQPNATALQFQKGYGTTNGTLSAVGWDDTRSDVLSVWTNTTTHFVVDLTAAVINHWASLGGSPLAAATPAVKTGVQSQDAAVAGRQAALAAKIADWTRQPA